MVGCVDGRDRGRGVRALARGVRSIRTRTSGAGAITSADRSASAAPPPRSQWSRRSAPSAGARSAWDRSTRAASSPITRSIAGATAVTASSASRPRRTASSRCASTANGLRTRHGARAVVLGLERERADPVSGQPRARHHAVSDRGDVDLRRGRRQRHVRDPDRWHREVLGPVGAGPAGHVVPGRRGHDPRLRDPRGRDALVLGTATVAAPR